MTNQQHASQSVYEESVSLIKAGASASELVRDQGMVEQPIPIQNKAGVTEGWFVPITVGDKLAGYLRFNDSLTFQSFSGFGRSVENVEDCPSAKTWIDKETILELARSRANSGDRLGEPYLGYDRIPSRIAWQIPVRNQQGNERVISVCGGYVFETDS